jgi:hypothetical protein
MIYVIRDGVLIEKSKASPVAGPMISRFEPYESPIDGARITSDRQRERDLYRSGSFDPRDLPKGHNWSKGRDAQRNVDAAGSTGQQLDFWR